MKINRHGQAKILTPDEINRLFQVLTLPRDITLFKIMLFTACRVREAVTLRTNDIYDVFGSPRDEILFRKGNTKGKLDTRTIPTLQELRIALKAYRPHAGEIFLFPSSRDDSQTGHLNSDSAQRILMRACKKAKLDGVSSHSFRRTALTMMSNNGIPLRVIQEISGHRNLGQLQKYLEVKPEQVKGAIATLSLVAPIETKDVQEITTSENIRSIK